MKINKPKVIVFDFGNVIINIDFQITFKKFGKLCHKTPETIQRKFENSQLFRRYESGLFSDDEFYEIVRQEIGYPLDNKEIKDTWNALLLDIPQERMDLIQRLKRKFPVYLLSNTNHLHIQECNKIFQQNWNISSVHDVFTKAYLSYEIGMWKPDEEIYEFIIEDIGVQPYEILFVDDNLLNIESAKKCGLQTIHVEPPQCITHLLAFLE